MPSSVSVCGRWLAVALCVAELGCTDEDRPTFASGAGAFPSTGGTGGAVVGAGGVTSTGGIVGSGGVLATGGAVSTGGVVGSGGVVIGTGGAVNAGGIGTGGVVGSGGVVIGGVGGVGGTGGTSSGGAGGASGGGGTGGIGIAIPTVEQLFPLAVGNVWNYQVTALPGGTGTPACAAGMHATTITGRMTFAGENAFTATHVCAPTATRYYVENAKGLEVNVGTTWSMVLPRPIADGAEFMAASTTQVLAKVADSKVPAGTFSNCWQTEYETANGPVTTYCAGVGLVSLEYQGPNGGGYRIQLASYKLN